MTPPVSGRDSSVSAQAQSKAPVAEGHSGDSQGLSHTSPAALVGDMVYVEPGDRYAAFVLTRVAGPGAAVSSLVCNGGVAQQIDAGLKHDDALIGRGLVTSYVTCAYNAVADEYRDSTKFIEHCMFRTTGDRGYVLDYSDRVWPEDSVGTYMTLGASGVLRADILDTSNQVLGGVGNASPAQFAAFGYFIAPSGSSWDPKWRRS